MIDISPADEAIVNEILKKYVPKCEVRVFGSRHTWTAKSYSDLDLAIVGDVRLDKKVLYALQEAFEESELNFRVDVLDWHAISDEFRAIIEQGYSVIQEAENKLPAGWVVKKLGDVITLQRGHDLPKTKMLVGVYPVAGSNGIIGYHNSFTTKEKGVTIGRSGNIGKPQYYEQKFWAHNTVLYVKDFKGNDEKFIYYLLKTMDFSILNSGSAVPTLNRNYVHDTLAKIPTKEIQKEIAAILSSLDDKIELNQQINKKLEEMAQAIFKEWFIDFNFPDENGNPYRDSGGTMIDSELGQIPATWSVKSLDEVANFTNGLAMQKFRPIDNECSLPVLKIKELRQGNTDINSDRCKADIPDSVKIFDGDVIFSWSGSLMVELWTGGDAGLNQHLFKVTSDKYSKIFYYLWTKHHLAKFIAIAQDKATTMGHIQRKHLSDAKIFCPNNFIMDRFNHATHPMLEQLIAKNIEISNLINLRDTLLPKLMYGELEITIINVNLQNVANIYNVG